MRFIFDKENWQLNIWSACMTNRRFLIFFFFFFWYSPFPFFRGIDCLPLMSLPSPSPFPSFILPFFTLAQRAKGYFHWQKKNEKGRKERIEMQVVSKYISYHPRH